MPMLYSVKALKRLAGMKRGAPAANDRSPEEFALNYFTAQPPLPLQEFLPLQPLSPVLQPPLPLQEFLPAQSCFSTAPFFSPLSAITPALEEEVLPVEVAAEAMDPVRSPARAAPASRVVEERF